MLSTTSILGCDAMQSVQMVINVAPAGVLPFLKDTALIGGPISPPPPVINLIPISPSFLLLPQALFACYSSINSALYEPLFP